MIGAMLMIAGITVLALMTGVLATGFAQEERRREYLRVWDQVARVPIFASLGVVTLSEIVGKLRTRYYPPRITVVRRGDPGDSMFFISSGEVEVRLPNGGAVRLGEGAFFGEMALLERQPRSASVATTKPTTLLVLYASDFYEIASHIPALAEAVEVEARRRREENLGRQSGGDADDRRQAAGPLQGRHRHWPGPRLRLYRGASRGCRRPLRPLLATKAVAMSLITPVILVGGSGKRLWPLSRESMPKQFVPLLGTQSTFQQTLERVADRSLFARPVIATNDAYRFMAEQQAKDIGMEIDILVEPSRRDSGPAMAAAAAYARNQGAKAVLALASDHLVIGAEEFRAACREGLLAVAAGRHRHLRHSADRAQDRLRLYPAGQRAHRPGAEGRGLRREAQRPDGAALHRRGPAVEQRQLPVPARAAARRKWPASSPPWPPPPRKPSPRPRRPARRCSSMPRPSPRRRPSRSTTPSWSAPTNAGSCRPSSAGPTSAPGTRCSMSARPTARATSPRGRSRSTMCAIPTSAPTGR